MIPPSRRLQLLFLALIPALITLVLTIFFLSSKHVGGLSHFMPLLPLIPVFYWGMAQARDMPYWFVFLLGLLMDAVTGLPLGLSSLLYIAFLILLHSQRKYIYKEGFVMKWAFFAALLAAPNILSCLMLWLFYAYLPALTPVLLQWLLTVCCYPVMHKGFDRVFDYILSRRWQLLHGH